MGWHYTTLNQDMHKCMFHYIVWNYLCIKMYQYHVCFNFLPTVTTAAAIQFCDSFHLANKFMQKCIILNQQLEKLRTCYICMLKNY